MEALLKAVDVSKTYHSGSVSYRALRGVSLSVQPGEFVAIVGPSGCGKSTLLHLLGGLDRPDSGDVLLEGKSICNLDETSQTLLRRRRIGFVFQKVHLRLDGVELATARPRGNNALAAVGMEHKLANRPGELSGGEAQRVAIARALVMSPAILLADEPTGALDSANGKMVIDLFREVVNKHHQTLVIVTHDMSVAAAADRVVKMRDGEIVDEQNNSPSSQFTVTSTEGS
jgi:putative ABC transport system ATP-binding protein